MTNLLKALEYEIEGAQKDLNSWTEDLAKNPGYACEWADRMFEAAAQIEVLTRIQHALGQIGNENDWSVADYNEWLTDTAQSAIQEGLTTHSTSPSHNQAKRSQGAMWMKYGVRGTYNRTFHVKEN